MLSKSILVALLLALPSYGQEPDARKPLCTKQNLGMLWHDTDAASPRAAVEICSVAAWRYRWKPATVDVSELLRKARRGDTPRDAEAAPAPKPAN